MDWLYDSNSAQRTTLIILELNNSPNEQFLNPPILSGSLEDPEDDYCVPAPTSHDKYKSTSVLRLKSDHVPGQPVQFVAHDAGPSSYSQLVPTRS